MFFRKKEDQSANNLKKEPDIELPGRPTGWRLKFGYWFTVHRLQLRQALIIFLIILAVLFWFYVGYRLLMIFTVENQQLVMMNSNLARSAVNFEGYKNQHAVQPPVVLGTEVLAGGEGKYDIFAGIKNPNSEWLVESFNYKFILNNGATTPRESFILPGEEKYLMELAVESDSYPGQVRLEINDLKWLHLDKHQIPDFASFYQNHFNFNISNINFIPSRDEKVPVSQVDFEVINNSAYNFWQVGFQVILYSGQQKIAGVNYLALEQFKAGEKRSPGVYWYEPLPHITKVEIIPEVNILDSKSYMKFEGGTGEIK